MPSVEDVYELENAFLRRLIYFPANLLAYNKYNEKRTRNLKMTRARRRRQRHDNKKQIRFFISCCQKSR